MFVERILATQGGRTLVPPRTTLPTASVSPLCLGGSRGLLRMWIETAGVLYEDTCWWRWLSQVLARMGVPIPHDRLREMWTWHWESARADAKNGDEFWYVLAICLQQMGLSKGGTQEVLAAAVARQKQLDHREFPYRGVSNTLAQLVHAGVQLAALCDAQCSRERLLQRLHRLSLTEPFLHFFASAASGRSLRHGTFYRDRLKQLGLMPSEVVFVSSQEQHVRAAGHAGLATIAIACSEQVPADLHLEVFTDLQCEREPRSGSRYAA